MAQIQCPVTFIGRLIETCPVVDSAGRVERKGIEMGVCVGNAALHAEQIVVSYDLPCLIENRIHEDRRYIGVVYGRLSMNADVLHFWTPPSGRAVAEPVTAD